MKIKLHTMNLLLFYTKSHNFKFSYFY